MFDPPFIVRTILLFTLPLSAAAQQSELEGSWEGEFETPRAPVFLTLHIERDGPEWGGRIVALGRTDPLEEVEVTQEGVRAVVVPEPGGFVLEADLSHGRLTGWATEGDERFPLELVRVPRYPAPNDRVEAWLQDLDALVERFLRFDRSFTPAERSLFQERIQQLRDRYMTSPEALHGLGLAPEPERISFAFSGCGSGRLERSLEPLPFVRGDDPVEAWWDLSPRHHEPGWIQVLEASEATVPLYLHHPDRHYWFEYLEDSGILYVQYNRAAEMEGENTSGFGQRLLTELRDRDVCGEPCPEDVPCFLDLSSPEPRLDIPVSTTWTDYVARVDPSLDAVRRRIPK